MWPKLGRGAEPSLPPGFSGVCQVPQFPQLLGALSTHTFWGMEFPLQHCFSCGLCCCVQVWHLLPVRGAVRGGNCKDLKGCPFGPYPMNMSTHGRTEGCTPHTVGTGRDGSCPPPWEKWIRQSQSPTGTEGTEGADGAHSLWGWGEVGKGSAGGTDGEECLSMGFLGWAGEWMGCKGRRGGTALPEGSQC